MSIYELQLPPSGSRGRCERSPGGVELDVRGGGGWGWRVFRKEGSSADPRDVLQTDVYVLDGPPATFPAWHHPRHCHTTLLSYPLLTSQTHTHTLSSVLKHVYQGSTTAWRANVFEGRLAGEWERMAKCTRLCFCFHLFFSSPPMCAVVDHVECTSIW